MGTAEKMTEENNFSYDGYQVVRGEFFAHTFEPSITFNGNRVYVNTACLNRMPTVEYIQILTLLSSTREGCCATNPHKLPSMSSMWIQG